MYLIKRQLIRQVIIDILLDDTTLNSSDCSTTGLTTAKDTVLDTPLEDLLASCENADSNYELPAIAVYTENEFKTFASAECADTKLNIVIELYACSKTGYLLESQLDELEGQVRYKVLQDGRFRNLAKIESWHSQSVRDCDGRKLGIRRLTLNVEYQEGIVPCLEDIESMNVSLDFRIKNEGADNDVNPTNQISTKSESN